MKTLSKFIKYVNKSFINKLCVILIILLILTQLLKFWPVKEGLSIQNEKYKYYDNSNLYDNFYASVYDKLIYSPEKNAYEITEILNHTKLSKNKNILDIGSGTGHHCYLFKQQGYNCIGIDKSPAMNLIETLSLFMMIFIILQV